MNRRPAGTVLLIAYHYPPCAMSSGLQRTLAFSIHLREHGWQPLVLTAHAGSYERSSPHQLSDIPSDVPVARTWAPDAARHLAIKGRHWSRLATPDRWRGWWLTAVPRGLQLIRRHHVDVIWSTYPIATAHAIGASLSRITHLPWIADFRDPMVEQIATGEIFPADPMLRSARLRIEAAAARNASRLVFCTDGARRIVAERYPELSEPQLAVIPNGFDEQAFRDAEALGSRPRPHGRRVLLHSGTIYPGEDRDPTALMQAVRILSERGAISPLDFELRLRDPSNEAYFRRLAAEMGIADFVSTLSPLAYRDALAEMRSADALLLLQGHTSNPAIPAKLYEYLRARRPILALAHPDGETAAALRRLDLDTVAPLTDRDAIVALLSKWLSAPAELAARLPPEAAVAEYSRARLTARLARMLDEVKSATQVSLARA